MKEYGLKYKSFRVPISDTSHLQSQTENKNKIKNQINDHRIFSFVHELIIILIISIMVFKFRNFLILYIYVRNSSNVKNTKALS